MYWGRRKQIPALPHLQSGRYLIELADKGKLEPRQPSDVAKKGEQHKNSAQDKR
jgi:hypothetical protein